MCTMWYVNIGFQYFFSWFFADWVLDNYVYFQILDFDSDFSIIYRFSLFLISC